MPPANASAVVDERPSQARNWPISFVLVVTLSFSLGGIAPLLRTSDWWALVVVAVAVVTLVIGVMRTVSRWAVLAPLAGIAALALVLTFFFAPELAIATFVPTPEVFAQFQKLMLDGFESIASQSVPARVNESIVFLLVAGVGTIAIVLDTLVFIVRRPALVGIPLIALLAVGSIVDPTSFQPLFATVTALGYLLVLYLAIGERRVGGAIAAGAVGLIAALVLPLALPAIVPPENNRNGSGYVVGVNSFLNLGEDLRRPSAVRVLSYSTDSGFGQYLTLSVIDNFTGSRWSPKVPAYDSRFAIDEIDPSPGLSADVTTLQSTTTIKIGDMGGKWLPAPYSPRAVDGVDGDWSWDKDTRTISSPTASMRGAEYTVLSDTAGPTVQDLRASGLVAPVTVLADELVVPTGLDPIVAQTALDVTAGANTHYDMAIALQDYFTTGDFSYSTRAPVIGNYDGTGAAVIADFLEQKSGYCVHFASAMAVMARTLGIPARIAIGFTPGQHQSEGENDFYVVTTENLHAWPELYFSGVGWVRFEPTVSVGTQPVFADADAVPAVQPEVTAAPTVAPTRVPQETTTATPSATPTTAATPNAGATGVAQWFVVALLLGVPLAVIIIGLVPIARRHVRRLRRYWSVWRRGAPRDAWQELRDTALDFGFEAHGTTPRELAGLFGARLPQASLPALERLHDAIEEEAYSRNSGRATVADVRRVRSAIWWKASREQRLRAAFTPQSVSRPSVDG